MFRDPEIRRQFNHYDNDNRLWVSILNPTAKNIFLVVLRLLDPKKHPKVIPSELRTQVQSVLEKMKILLVLDNVREISREDYHDLEIAFEKSDMRSKVLITSNNPELVDLVEDDSSHIELKPLKHDESWAMLRLLLFPSALCPPGLDIDEELVALVEVDSSRIDLPWTHDESWDMRRLLLFPSALCPPGLDIDGELIADSCMGLPQKIASTAKSLNKRLKGVEETREKITVFRNFLLEIYPFNLEIYNELPYNLKLCFLYLGIFPRQYKFSVTKLIQMWIAEGFIPPSDTLYLEETAYNYLMQLVDSNMVKIEEKGVNGSAKTFSITESTRKFCKSISNRELNFFLEFTKLGLEKFLPAIQEVKKSRRICIHADICKFIPEFISSFSQGGIRIYLHSFVSHSEEIFTLRLDNIQEIQTAFKLLRVLDAKPIKVDRIDSQLCLLVHLRYITLSLNGDVLPADISRLRNVKTFVVYTTSRTLKIKADILAMDCLSHFETNASAILCYNSKASEKNERFQTLCGISPKSCTSEFINKVPNLKKFGICGQLALLLLDGKNGLLSNLKKVEKLKMINQKKTGEKKNYELLDWITRVKHEKELSNLILLPSRFPPKLRSLTLSATSLKWENIYILGAIETLKVLKLKDNAFMGNTWEVRDAGFPYLQTLKIESLDFEEWKCSESAHFAQLRCLMLSNCGELKKIPIELAEIPTFQEMHLHDCKADVMESAKSIRDKKLEMKKTDDNIVFKLLPLKPLILTP